MIRPGVTRDGGEAWNTALLLLCCMKSVLLREEQVALIEMIKESDTSALMNALDTFEIPSANTVTAALSTRHSVPAIGEASEIWSLAARYQDAGLIMPPESAKWTEAWYIKYLLPDFAAGWPDVIEDAYEHFVLKQSPEYTTSDPPSLLGGNQSAGYKNTLYDILRANIQAYTKTGTSVASGDPVTSPK
jgi:hypothetical protein